MTLLIINTKINSNSRYYRLYKIVNGAPVEIGFSGLGTDYEEIKENKKNIDKYMFCYKSKKYRADGIPRDIIYKLKDKFSNLIYIDSYYNGVYTSTIKHELKQMHDNYYEEA
jgi:galactokinase/mevalonate kinase-like predicted kinase